MKTRVVLFCFSLLLVTSLGYAQKKKEAKSIISANVAIKKYHNKADLDRMQKGELLDLYVERIESLVKLLPYIAFATKPGVTMTTLGIPNDNDNRKSLDDQFEATADYLEKTKEFQSRILPYSDTDNLVAAILFYEETMKSLHEYSEFH
ncbi:hypothetical protein ACFFU1_07970 [Algibacter miyuki]|uniref:Gliding motility-associated protein GldM N-terminal domain-containing protein n=1 Tax=Algibacter miyuki TaxID=1306933 RepID=A0ABV5GYW1_9FLAO|nr:hypothetical protein [Algibacter miyuki]MDN3666971.1 hypothetical protein [Algibacter miyuki]